MERRFYQSKSSLYNLLRNSKINDFTNLNSKAITSSIQKSRVEYRNIIQLLSKLQSSVVQKGNNIDDIVKQIELCFENKSNDQSIIMSLYTSKVFLDIFNAYNISLSEYQEKILNLIEKILQNKKIGKKAIYTCIPLNSFNEGVWGLTNSEIIKILTKYEVQRI